jgi:hypothetical protein
MATDIKAECITATKMLSVLFAAVSLLLNRPPSLGLGAQQRDVGISGPPETSAKCPLSGEKQTSNAQGPPGRPLKRKLDVTAMRQVPFPITLQAAIRSRLGVSASPSGNGWVTDVSEASESEKTNSQRSLNQNVRGAKTPDMLPASDVVRALLRFRFDPQYRGKRRVPIRILAAMVGLSHETLYEIMRAKTASECTRAKLTWALKAIAEGRLRFRRSGQRWGAEGEAVSLFRPITRDPISP